ncbi:MAG: hypothetical protein J6A75_12450 [Lachnospiraceae bacterium]|nr:hypothetical protein [Lachnospiraceae bacterium]
MIHLKIAVLDKDKKYLARLRAYLLRKKEQFFLVYGFGSKEEYLNSKERFDALLVTGELWEKDLEKCSGTKVILLHEGWVPAQAEGVFSVAKYQSAERLFRQISALLWQQHKRAPKRIFPKDARLIGVYSPVHVGNQMLFSMTMARLLGEQEKVLYINLMEHSGFYSLTEAVAEKDIGDLLYGMLEMEHNFTMGLHSIRQTYANFDYIPPAVNPEHLSEIPRALYEKLFFSLKHQSGYDVVIIDFGMVFLGFAETLSVLERLYCLGKSGKINHCRMEEFEEYLTKETTYGAARMQKLVLPDKLACREIPNPLDSSLYGEMGDYIRGYLYGKREIE